MSSLSALSKSIFNFFQFLSLSYNLFNVSCDFFAFDLSLSKSSIVLSSSDVEVIFFMADLNALPYPLYAFSPSMNLYPKLSSVFINDFISELLIPIAFFRVLPKEVISIFLSVKLIFSFKELSIYSTFFLLVSSKSSNLISFDFSVSATICSICHCS